MTSTKTFDYLTGYLSEVIEADFGTTENYRKERCTFRKYGEYDKLISRRKIGELCHYFEKYLCRSDRHVLMAGADRRTLYAFNGEYYEETGSGDFVTELIKRTMERMGVGRQYVMAAPARIAMEVLRALGNTEELLFRPDRRYICFTNGVLDLKDGKLKKFDIRYCTDIVLDFEYKDSKQCYMDADKKYGADREKNPCKLWEWKIEQIIPNKQMRDAFQMFCGTLLVKREELKVEYICYLIGSGSNGKSVAASAIAGVFGEKYFGRFTPYDLFKASDAKVNMAALDGKIGNFTDDLEDKDFSGGAFKRFISGEKFQARRLYGNPFLVQAPVMLCCTNSMPESSDDSWGHHRRQLPIHTTMRQWTESDKDPYLTQKLTTADARQYIFTWIFEGYRRIMRHGGNIVLGDDVVEAQRVLQADSSSVRRWGRDAGLRVIPSRDKEDPRWKPLKELYAAYCAYAQECGYDKPKDSRDVAAMLKSMGCEGERRSSGWHYLVGVLGVDTDDKGELIRNTK